MDLVFIRRKRDSVKIHGCADFICRWERNWNRIRGFLASSPAKSVLK